MRQMFAALVLGVIAMGLSFSVQAEDKPAAKEVTLKGTVTCAKCDLGIAKKCETVIKVGDKVIYFDTAAHKKYHGDTCTTPKAGEVVGTVSKVKDKEVVKVKSVKYND